MVRVGDGCVSFASDVGRGSPWRGRLCFSAYWANSGVHWGTKPASRGPRQWGAVFQRRASGCGAGARQPQTPISWRAKFVETSSYPAPHSSTVPGADKSEHRDRNRFYCGAGVLGMFQPLLTRTQRNGNSTGHKDTFFPDRRERVKQSIISFPLSRDAECRVKSCAPRVMRPPACRRRHTRPRSASRRQTPRPQRPRHRQQRQTPAPTRR